MGGVWHGMQITPSVPRSEAAIHLSGSHMTTSTTDEGLEAVGQTLDLATDYLPEVENFDVQLKKDNQGLGITIAGYVCERGILCFFLFNVTEWFRWLFSVVNPFKSNFSLCPDRGVIWHICQEY